MVKFLTFFKNSRKIEGATNERASCTQRNGVVHPTIPLSRFGPPTPQNFLGAKTIFRLLGPYFTRGHFGAYTTDNYFLCCVLQRTKLPKNLSTRFSNYAPVWEICPLKNCQFFDVFLKNCEKSRKPRIKGHRAQYVSG